MPPHSAATPALLIENVHSYTPLFQPGEEVFDGGGGRHVAAFAEKRAGGVFGRQVLFHGLQFLDVVADKDDGGGGGLGEGLGRRCANPAAGACDEDAAAGGGVLEGVVRRDEGVDVVTGRENVGLRECHRRGNRRAW